MHSSQYLRKDERVVTGALQRAHSIVRSGMGEVRLYLPSRPRIIGLPLRPMRPPERRAIPRSRPKTP